MSRVAVGCFFAAFLISMAVRAQSEPRPVQDWRAVWGDVGPGADASGWRAVSPFAPPAGERSPDHVAWYRVTLPKGQWRDPALFAGKVSGALEVYWDGRKVGGFGEVRPGSAEDAPGEGWVMVPLPEEATGGEVFLRVQSSHPWAFGVQRELKVGSRAALVLEVLRQGLPSLLVGLLLSVVGLVGLLVGGWQKNRGVIAFGLFALVSGVVTVTVGDALRLIVDAPGVIFRLLMGASVLFVPALMAFLVEYLPTGKLPWFRRTQRGLTVFACAYALLVLVALPVALSVAPLLAGSVLVGLGASLVVVGLAVRQNEGEAGPLAVGLVLLLVTAFLDAVQVLGAPLSTGFVMHWGMLAMAVSFGVVVAQRAREVADDLSRHAAKLEQHHGEVRAMGAQVAAGATQLLAAVQQLTASSSAQSEVLVRQASALQETQVTAEEIKRTSQMAAQKSTALLEGTTEAEAVGRAGEVALERSVGGLEAIGREVSDMARQIGSVEAHTQEIAGIIETVKGLADQSNMLALNAAIEAVRSGEHGKGFAVVAREVRRLADQSLQSVSRIQGILDTVVAGIRESVALSERGEKRVAASLAEVRDSAGLLQRLGAIVQETGSSVRQISAAVSQQNAGVSEIFAAIADLSRQMEDTVVRVHEAELAAAQVKAVAESLTHAAAPAKGQPARAA